MALACRYCEKRDEIRSAREDETLEAKERSELIADLHSDLERIRRCDHAPTGRPLLKTETDTLEMRESIERAFVFAFDEVARLHVFFEHGQHWVTDLETGKTWSVVDVEGPSAIDGFGFEEV